MKAGDVFVAARAACSCSMMSCRTRCVALAVKAAMGSSGNALAQAAQLAVFGTEFVAPFGDAVRFVDGEKRDRARACSQAMRVLARQPLGRKIQQAILARARLARSLGLLALAEASYSAAPREFPSAPSCAT